MSKTNNKAFTLIELLVVIAIIGILTAIVMTNFATAKSKSRDAKRVSDIAQLQLAMELFFDRCNRYPVVNTLTSMPLLTDSGGTCPSGVEFSDFISSIPTSPSPGSTYSYGVNNATTPTDYVLKAVLENNNSVLTDSIHGDYTALLPDPIDCQAFLDYCVQPR